MSDVDFVEREDSGGQDFTDWEPSGSRGPGGPAMTGWVPRSEWTDVPARGGTNRRNPPKSWVRFPAPVVVIHYVGSKGGLSMPSDPRVVLRSMQDWGWKRDGAGIEYGAVTFHDGSTWGGFEGQVGAHASTTDPQTGRAFNYSSWGICAYLGGPDESVPDPMLQGLVDGIRHAQAQGWVTSQPRVIGHRDTGFATDCPGRALYPLLAQLGTALGAPAPAPAPDARSDPAPGPTPPPVGGLPTLAVGATGKSVHLLQALLIQRGILQDSADNRDGVLGPPTARKVGEFQARHGLPETGQVDVASWRALLEDGFVRSLPELGRGATGNEVFVLQCLLIQRGVIRDTDDNRDRSFGPGIEGKVRVFQTQNGLPGSGRVDRATWVALTGF